jgi:TPR repeat protein
MSQELWVAVLGVVGALIGLIAVVLGKRRTHEVFIRREGHSSPVADAGPAAGERVGPVSRAEATNQAHPAVDPDTIYTRGVGLYHSKPYEAVACFRVAAERGHAPAQTALGMCLRGGHGTLKNIDEGNRWLAIAARNGDETAIKILAGENLFGDVSKVMKESERILDQHKQRGGTA